MGRLENLDKDNNKRQIARLNNRAFLCVIFKGNIKRFESFKRRVVYLPSEDSLYRFYCK